MANIFVNLPAVAANAPGAGVDVSAMGMSKSIVVSGSWGTTITPFITIEINNDPGQAGSWTAIWSKQGGGTFVMDIACKWMRTRVSNYSSGEAPVVNVGSDDTGTTFAALAVPAGSDGAGAWVDVSGLPLFKTIQVGGAYQGAVIIEVSEDGATSSGSITSFQGGQQGQQSIVFAAHWMRARRAGVPVINPGTPVINVGACSNGGGGGGGVVPADLGTPQGFSYTVLGTEPDLSNLTIPLPTPRAAATYNVVVTQQTATYGLGVDVPQASKAVGQFVLELSGAASAGDKFGFLVFDNFDTV